MHSTDMNQWTHSHDFSCDTSAAERRTHLVIAITAAMMLIEIVAGRIFHSMALLADGWHMSTHVVAFLITALAYYFSRRRSSDPRYSFGTGKVGVLGGFASAMILAMIALIMAGESVLRIFSPLSINFNDAIAIAIIGLVVNLLCAVLFKDSHHHHDQDGLHSHSGHHHDGHDLNRRAAYIHVLADALTSVLAIIALLAGKFFGWSWFDPIMGIVGSLIVGVWACGLIRDTSGILLDRTPESSDLIDEIRQAVEQDGDSRISDLHVWQVGSGKFAAIVSIIAHEPRPTDVYRDMCLIHEELVHVTIEVQRCPDHPFAKTAG